VAQVGQRLGAIGDHLEAVVHVLVERLAGHQHITRVVLHQQHIDDPRCGVGHADGSLVDLSPRGAGRRPTLSC
jgi:hypothetical protein